MDQDKLDQGPGDGATPSGPGPSAPTSRPLWFRLITFFMLMTAANWGFAGIAYLTSDGTSAQDAVVLTALEALWRVQQITNAGLLAQSSVAASAHALLQLVVAALFLYAVAMLYSRDPQGRKVVAIAALAGIVYRLFNLWFALAVWKPAFLSALPQVLDEYLQGQPAGENGADATAIFTEAINAQLLVEPFVFLAIGVAFHVLTLIFFQGKRGRELYGLSQAGSREH